MRYWKGLEQGEDNNCKQGGQKKPLKKDPQFPLRLSEENMVHVEG